MLQYFVEGEEYTTRARLQAKYKIPSTTLHYVLEKVEGIKRIQDRNKFYFHKEQAEALLDLHTGQ